MSLETATFIAGQDNRARRPGPVRSLPGRSGIAIRFTHCREPRSNAARTGSQASPYSRRSRAGIRPAVTRLTASIAGRRASGTGG